MLGKSRTNSSPDAGPSGSRPAKAKTSATANRNPNPTASTRGPTKKRGLRDAGNERASKKIKSTQEDGDDDSEHEVAEADDFSNGLDRSASPISNVYEAFIDLVKKANEGLTPIANGGKLFLRVGTMCSGTEAPIFALRMIREAYERLNPGKQFLEFDHKFSVENDPVKQAYIMRNTDGSTVFQNVRDFVDSSATHAPTAMGGLALIPKDVDLLIAGCSCVEFSNLNTKKKHNYNDELAKKGKQIIAQQDKNSQKYHDDIDELFHDIIQHIDELGESGQTFFSMLSYVRNHRPRIVMLENVMNAPWDQNKDIWFPYVGYAAAVVRVDTKNYWIPQTRTRGYLIAIDRRFFGESAENIVNAWADGVKNLKRRASSPVTNWILDPTHSLAIRACQDDGEKALNGRDRDSKWSRSGQRHIRARETEALGNDHLLTRWNYVIDCKPWDKMSPLYLDSLNNRSKDCIEIWHLRALKNGLQVDKQPYTYDTRYKIRIFDLSQNIDRGTTGSPFGISPCNTPRGDFYLSTQARSLSGYESLGLQGLPINDLDLSHESQDQLRDLAGNAMSTTVVGAGLAALFTAIHNNSGNDELRKLRLRSADQQEPVIGRPRLQFRPDLTMNTNFNLEPMVTFSIPSLIETWKRCRRYCFCNGAVRYSSDSFRLCSVCGTIRCCHCAGNPAHEFVDYTRTTEPVLLEAVPHTIMSFLPSTIVNLIDNGFDQNYSVTTKSVLTIPGFATSISCATFYYKEVHVTEAITICFTAKHKGAVFRLQAVVSEDGLSWYLYLDPWCEMGQQALQSLGLSATEFDRPVAKAVAHKLANRPLPYVFSWQFWSFSSSSLPLHIAVPNGRQHLDISIMDSEELSSLPDHVRKDIRRIQGRYVHKPKCDSAEDSLHVGEVDGLRNGLYLFKDPTKTETPDHDCFVISKDCRQLEHYEIRETLVKFSKDFNLKKLVTQELGVTIEGVWLQPDRRDPMPLPRILNTFRNLVAIKIYKPRVTADKIEKDKIEVLKRFEEHDAQVLANFELIRHKHGDPLMFLPKYEHVTQTSGDWVTVERYDQHALYDLVSPVNIKLAGTELLKYAAKLDEPDTCPHCAPRMPNAYLIPKAIAQSKEKTQFELHHRYSEMTEYDKHLKQRRLPFEVQIKVTPPTIEQLCPKSLLASREYREDLKVINVRYAVNPTVLMHQALSYLPSISQTLSCLESRDQVTATMRTEVNSASNLNFKFEPFKKSLIPISGRKKKIAPVQQPGIFKGELSAMQSQSLAWMVDREQSKDLFTEQEIEEHLVPELRMRLVGCAQRKVCRHNGIVADDVGYGKTVISLALMGHQHSFDETESINLRAARKSNCIHLKASLVLAPKHLVNQWAQEARTFLEVNEDEILTINTANNLKIDINKMQKARVIIVNSAVFNEKKYHSALAQYAGSLTPPTPDPENNTTKSASGRAFEKWYEETVPVVQEHIAQRKVALEQNNSLATLHRTIRHRFERLQINHDAVVKDRYNEHTREGRMVSGFDKKDVKEKSAQADPNNPFSGFVNLLESFSFSRVIYDEFSYRNSMASLFFKNVTALSKWVLSATPPTKNLAAICDTGMLINVHVARPMELRIGLPKITEGPKLEGMTKAETQLSYGKLASDQIIQERQHQAHEFLKMFASQNPLDRAHFGGIQTDEHVVVCNMRVNETLRYIDLQSELQDNSLDIELLPKEFRKLLPEGLEWTNNNGKALAGQALMLTASTMPANVLARPEDLRKERKELLDSARAYLKSLSDKAIWLANRIINNSAESKVSSAKMAVKDICVLFDYILSENFEYFSGYDGWKAVFGAIFPDCEKPDDVLAHIPPSIDSSSDEARKLSGLSFHRKDSWAKFFTLQQSELGRVDEDEAKSLLDDIQQYSLWEVKRLGRPKDDLMTAISDLRKAENLLRKDPQGHPSDEALDQQTRAYNSATYTQPALKELCRQKCIKLSAIETKAGLAKRLAKHDLGLLRDEEYSGIAFRKLQQADFPFFDGKVHSRGGKYSLTRSETIDAVLEMKAALDLVVHSAKQLTIVENILKTSGERRCDNCGGLTDDLHLVAKCGHLLCSRHLGDQKCGDAVRNGLDRPSKCPSYLKDRTLPLSTIHGHQRSLPPPTGKSITSEETKENKATDIDEAALSSKVQMIRGVIRGLPKEEKVLLFAQFDAQINQLKELEREFTKYDDEKGPKLRILKLNAAESAGSNFQYANHVMFASPLSVDLQENYEAFMKQAVGRCVRYGQKKDVAIYHFVMANTIEVDILELRKRKHVLVLPGQSLGKLQYQHLDPVAEPKKDNSGDAMDCVMNNGGQTKERVHSNLSSQDVWRMMNETNWLTMNGRDS